MEKLQTFNTDQIKIVNDSVGIAEELVSNHYKMSASQWLHRRYDVKTLVDLNPAEIVHGPYAQIIRYKGQRRDTSLGSSTYDFYKICLQDHSILAIIEQLSEMKLFSFTLYIIIHELIHIVRFSKFLQSFDASPEEKLAEEVRVHEKTHEILKAVRFSGLTEVIKFYNKWRMPFDGLQNS
ncbi:MAG: hypothetical protein KJ550_05655 [Proteobacteria bacterium]|nr:hypothetical protein [Desulfobacteraceae bacterium]MBU3981785.1 hypothetical protein [Pseudomonadota bacterium]MBU4012933.1 hypothetical protein [Pseudomonadota bacterium]MBU4100059.1 hypothetical protein [Pseudomonadota bacterium]MBU4128091.1 hypothetical protein [Pseudomonadota bacterium]